MQLLSSLLRPAVYTILPSCLLPLLLGAEKRLAPLEHGRALLCERVEVHGGGVSRGRRGCRRRVAAALAPLLAAGPARAPRVRVRVDAQLGEQRAHRLAACVALAHGLDLFGEVAPLQLACREVLASGSVGPHALLVHAQARLRQQARAHKHQHLLPRPRQPCRVGTRLQLSVQNLLRRAQVVAAGQLEARRAGRLETLQQGLVIVQIPRPFANRIHVDTVLLEFLTQPQDALTKACRSGTLRTQQRLEEHILLIATFAVLLLERSPPAATLMPHSYGL
mmetsp:Transcript_15604/g.48521  ORF Transcript_15604/g.48521 Transcript_15604/m.48521 type:complete len:279 (-) Transcript_15604:124-960(-)